MDDSYHFPAIPLRQLIKQAIPGKLDISGQHEVDTKNLYVPTTHHRALNPDTMLVVGIRGAGKSFWWAALQSAAHRKIVREYLPRLPLTDQTRVSPGFGEQSSPENYPGKPTIHDLLRQNYQPQDIWRAIVIWHVVGDTQPKPDDWKTRIGQIKEHPELFERTLYAQDQILTNEGKQHLILFDALERTTDDWLTMRHLLKGLLQVLLEFRSYRAIRPKAFVRPDMLEDAAVTNFPDASKVINNKVDLIWPPVELYSLLWQYLGNGEMGEVFRDGCQTGFQQTWRQVNPVWLIPQLMRTDEPLQRRIFHALAGQWMGNDQRRGFPYTWLPNHLGDARRQASPRSFLAALRQAAEESADRYHNHHFALHYEAIKRGVQEASRIRVREMNDDYPWVEDLMKPLAGLSVPCLSEQITERWTKKNTLSALQKKDNQQTVKLPPQHLDEGPIGVCKDLEELGLFQKMNDDRINLPDVYRVGYGLKRRGGVKAIRKQ